MESVELRLDLLRKHQNTDGGWGYFPGKLSRVEPSCYALRAFGPSDVVWAKGIRFLGSCQEKSGGLNPGPGVPGATWVTQLAFPLLKQAGSDGRTLEAAANWILNSEGAEGGILQRLLYAMGKSKVEQDPRLKGWPWRPDNNSWVEPTAHGLLALHWMKGHAPEAGLRYRREIATSMLLDRRCSDGGWNYGNKKVLGETLPSYPETTALALLGLAASGHDLKASIERAKSHLAGAKGSYACALLSLALRLHGEKIEYQAEHAMGHPSQNLMLASIEVLASKAGNEAFLP